MSDFVIWLSPLPIPRVLRRRWSWPHSQNVALRRERFRELGHRSDEGSELVFVGHCRGQRPHRRFIPVESLVTELGKSLDERGPQALDDFLGPLAGAHVYDGGKRALIWRDRFGRHPLQMIRLSIGWAITTCPEVTARLSRGVPRWSNATNFVHGAHSTSDADVFTDVFRVRPGEVVCFQDRKIDRRFQWWTPRQYSSPDPEGEMRSMLHDMGSLYGRRPHLLALSAGLDSATLAAFISRRHPCSEAFTFADPRSSHDESDPALQIARHLQLRWSAYSISDHWPLSRLPDHRFPVAWGPPSHPDSAWKFPCYRRLDHRRPSFPLMYGNGADEVLWFPPRLWLESRWYRRDWHTLLEASRHLPLSRWLRAGAGSFIDGAGLRFLVDMLPRDNDDPLWERPQHWIGEPDAASTAPRKLSPHQRFVDLRLQRLSAWRWERVVRFLAFESRQTNRPLWTPFLDAQFWELSLSLSPEDLVEGGRQKAILRRITARLLPEDCRKRPKFGGFDDIVERGLADEASRRVYGLFARPALEEWSTFRPARFLEAYEAYRRAGQLTAGHKRGSWAIWRTIATELWLRHRHQRSPLPY